jgi:hypothetical protein
MQRFFSHEGIDIFYMAVGDDLFMAIPTVVEITSSEENVPQAVMGI